MENKLNHFAQYIQRLSTTRIPLRTRYNLFQTYALSHIGYIAGIIPSLKKKKQLELEKSYFSAIKKTMNVSKYTCHKSLLKTIGALHPRVIFYENFLRIYKKAMYFQQETTNLQSTLHMIQEDLKSIQVEDPIEQKDMS